MILLNLTLVYSLQVICLHVTNLFLDCAEKNSGLEKTLFFYFALACFIACIQKVQYT